MDGPLARPARRVAERGGRARVARAVCPGPTVGQSVSYDPAAVDPPHASRARRAL